MTLLSKPAILRHMDLGSIVIDPFDIGRLKTNSYDLELGGRFWRHAPLDDVRPSEGEFVFTLVDARSLGGLWLEPGERVLGHTVEFVGGRVAEYDGGAKVSLMTAVTTALHATSTAGRHGLTVCQCAGWGDVGYVGRWTLEIQNHTRSRFWLPVGAIVAQISFAEVEPPDDDYAQLGGRYQVGDDWTPEAMLPGNLKVAG